MTREECENQMLSKLKEIWDIFKEYDPQGNHLSLCAIEKEGEPLYLNIYGTKNEMVNIDCYRFGGLENE